MKTKHEWWTMYFYGSTEMICSKHKSVSAALLAASKCEDGVGYDHRIVEVIEVVPYKRKKK